MCYKLTKLPSPHSESWSGPPPHTQPLEPVSSSQAVMTARSYVGTRIQRTKQPGTLCSRAVVRTLKNSQEVTSTELGKTLYQTLQLAGPY